MPTGFTAGILDGEIKTFEQFAKQCMRNFGATIHMRDDPSDAEYTPRTPSDYHTKEIEKAKKLLADSDSLSDDEVMTLRKNELYESKKYHIEAIEKNKANAVTLERFLIQAKNFTPPTPQHSGIKTFMIEQLTSTIDFDCMGTYHHDKISEIDKELSTLSPSSVRLSMAQKASKDLNYHQEEHKKDLIRCRESNEWVEQLIKSLK